MIWCHEEAEQSNETISCDSRDTASGDERRERYLTGQDSAQQYSAKDEHDGDSVARLAIVSNATNPA